MRRMITNKQIDDIEQGAVLDQYLKPSAPILPLPEVPDVLVFNQYVDDFANCVEIGDYSVNFETHDITEWYPVVQDSNHLAELYFEMTDPIAFPEEIETVEELAQWIKENWQTIIYTAVLEDESMYLESSGMTSEYSYASIDFNDSDAEYESDGIYIDAGGVEYSSTYLQNLKLFFGVDKNLKINGVGEINSNQPINTTSTMRTKNLTCTDTLNVNKLRTYGQQLLIDADQLKTVHIAFTGAGAWISNLGSIEVGRIKAYDTAIHPYIDLEKSDETYAKGQILCHATLFVLDGLPTSDPHVAGAVWNDSGVLKISSGS